MKTKETAKYGIGETVHYLMKGVEPVRSYSQGIEKSYLVPAGFIFFNLDDAGVRLKKMMQDEIQSIIEGEYRPKGISWETDNHG